MKRCIGLCLVVSSSIFCASPSAAACKDVCKLPRVCSGDPPHENCLVPYKIMPDQSVEVLAPATPEELATISDLAKRGVANTR